MTSSTSDTDAGPVIAPGTETIEKAKELREPSRKRGGSSSTERVRRYRARKKGEAAQEPAPAPAAVTPDLERETAGTFAFVWDLVAVPLAKGRLRSLDEEQAMRAGRAFAPLVAKYLPIVADWQLEITAGMVLVSLVRECAVTPEPKGADDAEAADPQG